MIKAISALELLEIEKTYFYIATGSSALNQLLEGGIRTSAMTDIHGLSGSGKTQFCLELLVKAALASNTSKKLSGVYISSKRCFFPERMNQIVEQYKRKHASMSTENDVEDANLEIYNILNKILYKQVFDCEELAFAVHYLKTLLSENKKSENNIQIIVIDSFSAHIRDLPSFERIRFSYELMQVLSSVAHSLNCAVVLTSELTVRRERFENREIFVNSPVLGDTYIHRINQSMELEKSNDVIQVTMRKALAGKLQRTKVMLDENLGITDLIKRSEKDSLEQTDNKCP